MHPKLLKGNLLLFFLVVLMAPAATHAQTVPTATQPTTVTPDDSIFIRRLADTILTDGQAYGNLRLLTKSVGARLSGSAGYYKAEKWGQQALGAANADKVWLQECMVPHWVRGGRDSASWSGPVRVRSARNGDATGGSTAMWRGGLDVLALGNSQRHRRQRHPVPPSS
ncbi:hypothetical protein ACQ86N_01015 [Puia sp. P3]|uniref:hypothetical protein n=1 Tax=Puia sp. P3 TaxID=3423952 RepID=UPI003D669840